MRRILIILAPLLGFCLMIGGLYLGLFQNPQTLPSNFIGKSAPEINLPIFNAGVAQASTSYNANNIAALPKQPVIASAIKGKNPSPIVINYFASWCVPCRAEAGALLALRQQRDATKNADFQLIGIAYKDAPENTARFLREYGNPYDQIFIDADGRAGIDYGVYGIPETFLIDRAGIILHRFTGAIQLSNDVPFIINAFGRP